MENTISIEKGRRLSKRALVKPPTLTDVARLAGVSVPTASRVLNGGVRGDTSGTSELRERVRSAARRLGYAPNPAAQTIKGGRSKTIALLVGDIEDQGSATIIAGVMHAAERRGVSVAVRATADDARRERSILEALRGERHRGVIVATSRTVDAPREAAIAEDLGILAEQGARIVVIGNSTLGFPHVTIDNAAAAAALARGLVDQGARRFAILGGPENQITSRDRVAGFLEGLRARGISPHTVPVLHQPFSRDGGHAGFLALGDAVAGLEGVEDFAVLKPGGQAGDAEGAGGGGGLRRAHLFRAVGGGLAGRHVDEGDGVPGGGEEGDGAAHGEFLVVGVGAEDGDVHDRLALINWIQTMTAKAGFDG